LDIEMNYELITKDGVDNSSNKVKKGIQLVKG